MLHSTRFLNKLNRSIYMYLIPTLNPRQILGRDPGLLRFSEFLNASL